MNTSRREDEKVSNRQIGYGLVFGVPKSLSIYLAITGDEVVEDIARSAVDETMGAMESEMQCKVRRGGLHEDRRTGELLYSKFFHRDSRPINGLSDPHWHVHCFLYNATFDPVEDRWKAILTVTRSLRCVFLRFIAHHLLRKLLLTSQLRGL